MQNEQTNKADTSGTQADPNLATDQSDLSDYDKALALVEKRKEVAQIEAENLAKKEKLAANEMLKGETGGRVEMQMPKEIDPKEYSQRVLQGREGDGKSE